MELRHIRTFLLLAEELHFGRTAARLHVAQSAVSQTLKALEQEVGASLFDRTRRKVALSAAGTHFLAHAQRAIESLEDGSASARRAASGDVGRVVLGFTVMSALTVLPRAIARFQREFPGVELRVEQGGTMQQLEALRLGKIDLGFMPLKRAAHVEPFATEVLESAALMTFVPASHPLAKRKRVRILDLVDVPHVLLSRRSEPRLYAGIYRACAEHGFTPRIAMELEQLESLLAFVAAGVGITHAPAFLGRLRLEGVRMLPFEHRPMVGISVVWDARTLSPAASRFLEIARSERPSPARE
jgi:DNA-binding transcriptional LysR family regulator